MAPSFFTTRSSLALGTRLPAVSDRPPPPAFHFLPNLLHHRERPLHRIAAAHGLPQFHRLVKVDQLLHITVPHPIWVSLRIREAACLFDHIPETVAVGFVVDTQHARRYLSYHIQIITCCFNSILGEAIDIYYQVDRRLLRQKSRTCDPHEIALTWVRLPCQYDAVPTQGAHQETGFEKVGKRQVDTGESLAPGQNREIGDVTHPAANLQHAAAVLTAHYLQCPIRTVVAIQAPLRQQTTSTSQAVQSSIEIGNRQWNLRALPNTANNLILGQLHIVAPLPAFRVLHPKHAESFAQAYQKILAMDGVCFPLAGDRVRLGHIRMEVFKSVA